MRFLREIGLGLTSVDGGLVNVTNGGGLNDVSDHKSLDGLVLKIEDQIMRSCDLVHISLTLGTQRPQLEHLTALVCPRPFRARPLLRRFLVILS